MPDDEATAVLVAWSEFAAHADRRACPEEPKERCEDAARLIRRGRDPEFARLHAMACEQGKPLLEAWQLALEALGQRYLDARRPRVLRD